MMSDSAAKRSADEVANDLYDYALGRALMSQHQIEEVMIEAANLLWVFNRSAR